MRLTLTEPARTELETAAAAEKGVRRWKHYQAILLRAEGRTVASVAAALRCSHASVYAWTAAWRAAGAAGLRDGDHGGGTAKLGAGGEAVLGTELAQAGYRVGDRTVRRALHRLGYRWKRPRSVLGRPDPDYAETKGPSSLRHTP